MQPLKIIIPGNYWDSQIYSGKLYLFGIDGQLVTVDWERLISSWKVKKSQKLALICAFLRSDYLYGEDLNFLFKDDEIKDVVEKKFKSLSDINLHISKKNLNAFILAEQDNKFPFPHTDSEIYINNLYVGSQEGIYRASCNRKTKYPISTRLEKKWDAPVFSLSASYRRLALAAGDEGLYELKINPNFDNYDDDDCAEDNGITQLSDNNCISCNWAFQSIYGSSFISSGFLAAFDKRRDEYESYKYKRVFDEIISDSNIFHDNGFSWGVQDKFCQVGKNKIHVIRYNPWFKEKSEHLQDLGFIELQQWKGDVVSGKNAVFGIIIECDNAIVIVPSQGSILTIPGEPVNWRVFPRSKQYENQLHIIYEDRLEIFSFNHDYFVNQAEKRSGIQYFYSRTGRKMKLDYL